MRKPEITVTCIFADIGETAQSILLRSFVLFLRRELKQGSVRETLPTPMD